MPISKGGEGEFTQIPVEVVGAGGKTEWVMVEVSTEAVPEPGVAALVALSAALLLRRRRVK